MQANRCTANQEKKGDEPNKEDKESTRCQTNGGREEWYRVAGGGLSLEENSRQETSWNARRGIE
jgi:hypothetical protein